MQNQSEQVVNKIKEKTTKFLQYNSKLDTDLTVNHIHSSKFHKLRKTILADLKELFGFDVKDYFHIGLKPRKDNFEVLTLAFHIKNTQAHTSLLKLIEARAKQELGIVD